ncbi:hypothetical protein SDC9_178133 [bioreactor metagenome]|uniref:Uncharacterized protein n=1 Tax=bioreactor metagenome TaxID=1076179 RepID=A0A645GX97_9ZZZZ
MIITDNILENEYEELELYLSKTNGLSMNIF